MTSGKYHPLRDYLTTWDCFLIYTDTGVGKLPFQLVRNKEQTQVLSRRPWIESLLIVNY